MVKLTKHEFNNNVASFPDTKRFRQKKYEDAMAVVARFGKPEYLLTRSSAASSHPSSTTFTRMAYWENILPTLESLSFKNDAHIILTMSSLDKPETPEFIDRVISAEIPDPEEDDEKHVHYRLIEDFMLQSKI